MILDAAARTATCPENAVALGSGVEGRDGFVAVSREETQLRISIL